MRSLPNDADLLVVGAGPAGVAAAVMAASLRLRTVVVEAGAVGGKLLHIGALENVPGNWSSGPQLAQALDADLERLRSTGHCTLVRAQASEVRGYDDRAEVVFQDGRTLSAPTVVVATGVSSLRPADVAWVSAPDDFVASPLWRVAPGDLAGRTYVLGGDRPLGTWLRAHPKASTTLHVVVPPLDDYKVAEVTGDKRVRLVPAASMSLTRSAHGDGWSLLIKDRRGEQKAFMATTVLNNLGNKPAALAGLVEDKDGYCPSGLQHPRIRIAGDLRSARYQRIAIGQGSGAEAVLAHYYADALKQV